MYARKNKNVFMDASAFKISSYLARLFLQKETDNVRLVG